MPSRTLFQNIVNDLRESLSLSKHIPAYFTPNQSTGKWMAENPEINKTLEEYAQHRMHSADPSATANKLHSYLKGEKPPTKDFQDAANELIQDHKPIFQDELNKKLRAGLRGSAYTSAVTTPAAYYGYQYYKSKYPNSIPKEESKEQQKEAMHTQEFIDGFVKHANEKGISSDEAHWILNQSDRTPVTSNLLAAAPGLGALSSGTRALSRKHVLDRFKNDEEKDLWLKTHPYGHPGLSKLIGGLIGATAGGAAGSIAHDPALGQFVGSNIGGLAGRLTGYNTDESTRLNKIKQLTDKEKSNY